MLGFDARSADYAVQAGNPPDAVILVGGVTTGGVATKLRGLGATKSGDTYRFAADHTLSPDSRLATALPGVLGIDVVRVGGSRVTFAAAGRDLDLADGGSRTLADDANFGAATDCLGDPLGAELSDSVPHVGAQVRVVGVGLSRGPGNTPRETMCVVSSSDGAARTTESRVRAALSSGSSAAQDRPWKQLLPGATVSRSGRTVELTARSSGSPGLLLEAIQRADLPGVTG